MIQHDHISQILYWATKRPVPPFYQDFYLNAVVHSMAWHLLKGTLEIRYPGQRPRHYRAGCWIFHEAASGLQKFSVDAELISIRFDLLYDSGIPLFNRKESVVIGESEGAALVESAEEMVRVLDRWRSDNANYVDRDTISLTDNYRLESAFYAWIAEYIRLMQANGQAITVDQFSDPRVALAIQLINHHDLQEKLHESEIARQCNLSLNRLNALFRPSLGMTVGEFYTARRLRIATQELLKTAKPIKQIAFGLGFSSPAHFSNWFNDRQHISPREFRRQAPRN